MSLAEHLHTTVQWLLNNMSATEYLYWVAFMQARDKAK